jgi:hypothetical protein
MPVLINLTEDDREGLARLAAFKQALQHWDGSTAATLAHNGTGTRVQLLARDG